MKKLIVICICTVLYFNSVAQAPLSGFKFGGGLSVLAPVSNLKSYSVGVGLDLLAHYSVSSQLALTADVGYNSLFPKNKDFNSLNIVPIRAGIRFYPSDKFYIGGKAGVGFVTMKNVDGTSGFAYGAGVGFRMDDKLDIGLNYDAVSDNGSIGYLGLRLGYFFN